MVGAAAPEGRSGPPGARVRRYVRYRRADDATAPARYGVVEHGAVHELADAPYDGEVRAGRTASLDEVRLLAPCEPSKVLAVGLNFRSHLGGREAPRAPGLFTKLPTSIIGPGEPIVIPEDASEVHFEGELVAVIGRRTRRVSPAQAVDHIFGVTAGNDVSERTWQRNDLQWLRAKGTDTFGPLGPVLVRGLPHGDLAIETRLNGAVVQSERSRDLIFSLEEIVSYASRYVTLLPGDVIFTGTPGVTAPLSAGDVVEIEVEGVGTLANPIVSEPV